MISKTVGLYQWAYTLYGIYGRNLRPKSTSFYGTPFQNFV